MAWDSILVDRLRYFINDLSDTPTWSDNQLKKFIILAAIQVSEALKQWGVGTYSFDTANLIINPDPTSDETLAAFCNLIVIKAGIIIAGAEIKQRAASAGYLITDDKSTIDTRQVLTTLKGIQDTYTSLYENAMKDYKEGNKYGGSAVLSPFTAYDNSIVSPMYGAGGCCCRRA